MFDIILSCKIKSNLTKEWSHYTILATKKLKSCILANYRKAMKRHLFRLLSSPTKLSVSCRTVQTRKLSFKRQLNCRNNQKKTGALITMRWTICALSISTTKGVCLRQPSQIFSRLSECKSITLDLIILATH